MLRSHSPWATLLLLSLLLTGAGCRTPPPFSVTAYRLSPGGCAEPEGIPFYLPKPLLVVSKNFRYVEEAKVGLTDGAPIPNGVDDQSKYADVNARTNFGGLGGTSLASSNTGSDNKPSVTGATASSPTVYAEKDNGPNVVFSGGIPQDGARPDTFYTYQIVFVPDLTQKYGLKVTGGPGEVRAALNIVNGWQMTGLGPFYLKDSSTAQNRLANGISTRLFGQAASDVAKTLIDLRSIAGGGVQTKMLDEMKTMRERLDTMTRTEDFEKTAVCEKLEGFAEITVFEAFLTPTGEMEWRPIVDRKYSREVMSWLKQTNKNAVPKLKDDQAPKSEIAPPPNPVVPKAQDKKQDDGGQQKQMSEIPLGQNIQGLGAPNTRDQIIDRLLNNAGFKVAPQGTAVPTTGTNVNVNVIDRNRVGGLVAPLQSLFQGRQKPTVSEKTLSGATVLPDK